MEGLIPKYRIEKTDGSSINPKAKYFVLRYDANMKDKEFLKASQKALGKFILEIRESNHLLSVDLNNDLQREMLNE